jgi:ABC-type multidrug transport system fused ATPase/permease subunit
VNILLRFWEYQAGSIRLGGHDLRDYRLDDVRGMMGVVAQDTYLFSGTIRDNLLLANPDADDEQIVSACRQAQLDEFIQGLPNGYDTWIGENGLLLSGGERQRVAIARCILKDAPMLILDEATVHLDAVTETAVLDALRHFATGRTTVIISHRMQRLEPSDRVLMLGEVHVPERPAASMSA